MLFNKVENLIGAIIAKIEGITKPREKFMRHILLLFMGIKGKYNFMNMARYGIYGEQTYRNQFEKTFAWAEFNKNLIQCHCSEELIYAYDPSYLNKSGKKTAHVDWYWSGMAQSVKRGIEIGTLAVIDIVNQTGFSLASVQTPASSKQSKEDDSRIEHHCKVILDRMPEAIALNIKYLAVDAYFAKRKFVNGITKASTLEVISKLRNDANLRYLFTGVQKVGRGRKRMYSGKVDINNIDQRRIKFCFEDNECNVCSGIVYSISLKRKIRIVYIQAYDQKGKCKGHSIIFSTDLNLAPEKIYEYYRMRFQIEFLFRDAKGFVGLENCQARSQNKIEFHVNASLSTISLAKAIHFLPIPKEERMGFSMADVKTLYSNKIITEFIFSKLHLDLTCKKYRKLYKECLNLGRMAA